MKPARALALAALGALAAGGCAARSSGSQRISVSGPAWTFAGRPVTIEVTTHGALAEHRASLVVAVGNRVVGRVDSEGGSARVVIPAAQLGAGVHTISVKTGSERSTLELRVVPAAWPAAAAFVVAALAFAAAIRRRRHRLSR